MNESCDLRYGMFVSRCSIYMLILIIMVIIQNGCIKLYISLEWLLFIYRKQVFFALFLAHEFCAKDFGW